MSSNLENFHKGLIHVKEGQENRMVISMLRFSQKEV